MRPRLALTICLLLLAAACGQAPAPETAPEASSSPSPLSPGADGVLLTFDGVDVLAPTTSVAGVQVTSLGDAPAQTVPGGDGTKALLFPSYRAQDEQRLVLLMTGSGGRTASGSSGLEFGADVRLDAGATSGTADNGDNVVQRGLFADDDQYKLQVDHRVPSCAVRTPRGRVTLALGGELGDGWWRLRCAYDGVELHGTAVALGGSGAPRDVREAARLGALSFPPGTAVSVGGKVTSQGRLVTTQPDQLNGALDNLFVSPAP